MVDSLLSNRGLRVIISIGLFVAAALIDKQPARGLIFLVLVVYWIAAILSDRNREHGAKQRFLADRYSLPKRPTAPVGETARSDRRPNHEQETIVCAYKRMSEYHDDAAELAEAGWRVAQTVETEPRSGLFWFLFAPKPILEVTYERDVPV